VEWPAGPTNRDITGPSGDPAYCLDQPGPEALGSDGSQVVPIHVLQRQRGPQDRLIETLRGPHGTLRNLSRPSKSRNARTRRVPSGPRPRPSAQTGPKRGPNQFDGLMAHGSWAHGPWLMGSWPMVHGLMACGPVVCVMWPRQSWSSKWPFPVVIPVAAPRPGLPWGITSRGAPRTSGGQRGQGSAAMALPAGHYYNNYYGTDIPLPLIPQRKTTIAVRPSLGPGSVPLTRGQPKPRTWLGLPAGP